MSDAFRPPEEPAALMEPVDELRAGLGMGSSAATSRPAHAVELIQATLVANQTNFSDAMMGRAFGLHYPLRLQRERDALAQFRRAAGLPSSLIALETSLGLRHDINWSDVLNTPDKSEKSIDVHVAMERRTDAVPDLTGR